jgi:O-antigen ligase
MTSKGLKKDATDFSRLTSFDIHNIESGMTSIEMKDGGIKSFLYQLKYQLKNTDNPNGKSFLERVEYLKSGFHILATNWLIGVGAGDLQQTFNQSYDELNSKLIQENRHLTHNQFITFWIAAGFLCLLIFVGIWVVQLKNAFKSRSIEWLGFLGVLLISFLFEDTLQTQTGASFAALFIALFPLLFSTQNKE